MYAVCLFARFQASPKQSNEKVVKSIFKYLKGTLNYRLYYKKDQNFSLNAYIHVDWDGCVDERRSTYGSAFLLGDRLVSWFKNEIIGFFVHSRRWIYFCSILLY